jgi:hypothetical protein
VFFDPDVYPMNWAWWDGKMTLHHYQDKHGLDTAMITKSSEEHDDEVEVAAEHKEPAATRTKHGH